LYSIPGSDNRLQGGLILRHAEQRLVLLDQEGITVDVHQVDPAKSTETGAIVEFPFYHAVVHEIWALPIVPTRLGRSPLRPRRELGPRALFALDPVSACVDSRLGQDGFDRAAEILPPMVATCAPLTCPNLSSGGDETARVIPS
jgi:hypothetical protein